MNGFCKKSLLMMSTVFPVILSTPSYGFAQDDDADADRSFETQHIDLDEIVVTASPFQRALGQTISGVSLLEGENLKERLESSIGETLRSEPGVSSSFFGAGASRPIIRGLGGDRVRVLEDGIGTFDAAQTSPDHAVPVEPALAQKLEIFRGAASLLYGNSAAGGVVNVDTGKIPSAIPDGGFEGAVRYSHSTVNNGDEVSAGLNVALGQLVFHGEYFNRDADNYEIPGLNGSDALIAAFDAQAALDGESFDPLSRFQEGFVPNSDLGTSGGTGGVSYILDGPVSGFIGFSVSTLASNYGIPEGILTEADLEGEEEEGEEEEFEEEEGIRIDLDQQRYDIKGEFNGDFSLFETVKIRLGYGDYQHVELEGEEFGTLFENDEIEGRIELIAKQARFLGGEFRSAFGFQGRYRDFAAVGAEAFVPPSEQTQLGLFGLNEYRQGNVIIDIGYRYDHISNETNGFVAEEDRTPIALDNDFDLFSISGGVGYQLTPTIFVGTNIFRTERAPSLEESFSFGPHLATQSFEAGNPDLDVETARGIEATVRGEFGPLKTIINGFYTNYDNFIVELETGEILDNLPVFQFSAVDAEFRGFEAQADLDLGSINIERLGAIDFSGHAQADMVRATSSNAPDRDIPRIPPISSLFGLSASNQFFSIRSEIEYVTAQNNIANFELPTDSFVFINTFLSLRPFGERRDISFEIRGRNLSNNEGRVAASFLKDTTPLPGRDIRFTIRAGF